MTTRRFLASVLCVLAGSPVLAQSVIRFDMGPTGQTVASGFTGVAKTDEYPVGSPAYGWVQAPTNDFTRAAFDEVPTGHVNQALILDGSWGSDIIFRADVDDGDYRVVLYLGDPVDTTPDNPNDTTFVRMQMDVRLEGVELVDRVNVRTLSRKGSVDDPYGAHRRIHLRTTVSDGELDIRLSPSSHARSSLLGVEIYPDVPEPLRFDDAEGELVPDSSFGSDFDAFLTELHAGDYVNARTEALAIEDELASAYAAAWLAGWLTGTEEDLDVDLIGEVLTKLSGLSRDDVRVMTLRDECTDVLEAYDYNGWLGYTLDMFPDSIPDPLDASKGYALANLSAAVMLFEQVQSDLYGPFAAGQPQSPLFFRSQLLIARNHYSRNTKLPDPLAEFQTYWFGIIAGLWGLHDAHGIFAHDQTLAMFAFMEEHYSEIEGGIALNWGHDTLPTIPATYDPSLAWWWPMVDHADDPNAPDWANLQRSYHRSFRAIGDWWMANRFVDGQLGSGAGDDVEGAGVLSHATLMIEEPENDLDQHVSEILEKILFGPKIDQAEGYVDEGCGDVEHNAEFSSYPQLVLLPANYGNPKHWQLAHLTMRNFADQGSTDSWSTITGAGHRQFKSWNFDADEICSPTEDVPLNLKAILPGFNIIDYSAHPRAIDVFEELCDAWIAHLTSSADGKPVGVFPGSVDHGSPPSFGGNTSDWWKTTGNKYDLGPGTANQEFLYALARTMYLNSDYAIDNDGNTDIENFLVPALEGSRFLNVLLDGGLTGSIEEEGSDEWAAELLKSVIANAVAAARPFFAEDVAGATSQDLIDMDDVIEAYASTWAKFMLDPVKDKTDLEAEMAKAVDWVQYFLPLATTAVTFCDRIHLSAGGALPGAPFSHSVLFQSITGAGVIDGYPISWSNPEPEEGELDVAILVLSADQDGMEVLLFNYDDEPRNIRVRFMRGFGPGYYTIKLGEDDDHDDEFDGTPTDLETAFPMLSKSLEYAFTLPDGVLHKLEVLRTQVEPEFEQLPDPAIGDEDLTYVGSTLYVKVHNLGVYRVMGATFDVYVDDVAEELGVSIPTLVKNSTFDPIFTTVQVQNVTAPNLGGSIRVVLHPSNPNEITTANNEATLQF